VYTTEDIYNLCKKIHEILEKLIHSKNLRIALLDQKKQTLTFPYFSDLHDSQPLPRRLGKGLTEYVLKTGKPELLTAKDVSDLINSGSVELLDKPAPLWLGVPLKVAENTIGVLILKYYEDDKALSEEEVQIITFVAEQIAQAIQRRVSSEEIRKYADDLRYINSTKDKFFSIISHDLRAPLNGLLSFSELLLEDFATQPEHEKELFIQNLQSTLKSLLSLTENLLTWARIQGSGLTIEKQTITLKKLLNSVLESQLLVAGNKAITLEVICKPEIEVFADYNMLETVIRNLVSNAIKFTNRRGKIVIKAIERNDEVIIQVEDSGIGMSVELVSNLFRIDQKVTRIGTNSEKGTGLGLVICKEFIEKNGGSISVESAINTGTTISVVLKSKPSVTE
jgi:signal transduction histidine kinase